MAMADQPDADKARAEASFQQNKADKPGGGTAEYEAAARARDKNTERLKALRLAKEAADREAGLKSATKGMAKATAPRKV
jgi:hypothetical protein